MPISAHNYHNVLNHTVDHLAQVQEVATEIITPDFFSDIATRIAAVRRPSGTAPYTLGRELHEMWIDYGFSVERSDYSTDDLGTGNPILSVGNRPGEKNPHFILAHADEIGAVVDQDGKEVVHVVPDHAHRQFPKKLKLPEISYPAMALRYHMRNGGYETLDPVISGSLVTSADDERTLSFVSNDPYLLLKVGDRVVYDPSPRLQRSTKDSRILEGHIDNAVGAAAAFAAAKVLDIVMKRDPKALADVTARFVFDDMEEGNPDGPFAAGARRLATVNLRESPFRNSTYTVLDGHDASRDKLASIDSAVVANTVSGAKGPVLSPQAHYRMERLMDLFSQRGSVNFGGNLGVSTSRSSDNGLRLAGIPNSHIRVMGFAGVDYHMVGGRTPEASLASAVEAARLAAVLAVAGSRGLL